MSIQAMKKRFVSRFGKWILYFLAVVMVFGLSAMFAPSGSYDTDRDEEAQPGANDPMAKVNGQILRRSDFDRAYNEGLGQMQAIYQQVGGAIGVERLWTFRLESLEEAINDELIRQEAKARGIKVGRREIRRKIDENVKQTIEMLKTQYQGQDLEPIYAQIAAMKDKVARKKMSERQFRKWVARVFWTEDRPRLEMEVLTEKVKAQVAPLPTISEAELRASYDAITPREIVVALHPRGKPERTKEQARQRAEELLAQLRAGADFATLARQASDDEEAKVTGGLRESRQVRNMDEQWRKLVAPLKVGEVSEPLETPYAFSLIKVEQRESQLPPDFEKIKQSELESLRTQRQNQAWETFARQLRAKAKIEVVDAEMRGYAALREGKVEEGLKLLQQAAENPEKLGPAGAASVNFQLATYLAAQNRWKEAAEAYASADDYLQRQAAALPGARVQTLMGMGRAYENLSREYKQAGKTKEAEEALEESLSWYQVASEQTDIPSYHEQLQSIYRNLNQPERVQEEQQWLEDYRKAEAEKAKAYEEQQKRMEQESGTSKRPLGPAPAPTK